MDKNCLINKHKDVKKGVYHHNARHKETGWMNFSEIDYKGVQLVIK